VLQQLYVVSAHFCICIGFASAKVFAKTALIVATFGYYHPFFMVAWKTPKNLDELDL
jgi:hypothetical protein